MESALSGLPHAKLVILFGFPLPLLMFFSIKRRLTRGASLPIRNRFRFCYCRLADNDLLAVDDIHARSEQVEVGGSAVEQQYYTLHVEYVVAVFAVKVVD